MAVSGIDGGKGGYAQGGHEISAIELRIRQLEAQYIQEESSRAQMSDEDRETRAESLEEQVARLEQQLERASAPGETVQTERAREEPRQGTSVERAGARQQRFDTYEAQLTEPSAGLYRPVWDEEGRPGVEVTPLSEGGLPRAPGEATRPPMEAEETLE